MYTHGCADSALWVFLFNLLCSTAVGETENVLQPAVAADFDHNQYKTEIGRKIIHTLQGTFLWVRLTIASGRHHSCSRTWDQCNSCQCHKHISGFRVLSPPSRSASHCPGLPTTCRESHLGIKHRQTQIKTCKLLWRRIPKGVWLRVTVFTFSLTTE